ncbi:MAG TPA: HlyD family secretion protein [Polyangiales bacterium]|nr:HlyD family secretion protein [Polyangiales bacterium]
MSTTTAELSPAILSRADASPPSAPTAAKPRRRALIVLPVLALAAAGATTGFVLAGRGHETTDDAQIEGHVANVASRIGGQVRAVLVKDNQHVKEGELLVQLDDRDAKARLSAARADLAAARAQLRAAETQLALTGSEVDSNLVVAKGGLAQAAAVGGTTRAAILQAQADIAAATAQHALAASELSRSQKLFAEGALSESQLDARKRALEQTEAGLAQARARLASAESNLDNSSGTLQNARGRLLLAESGPHRLAAASAQVELAQARVEQAQAALEQAELNLSYTQIRSAVNGVVSRRSVEPGQLVSPDRALLAVVGLDDTWVVANFKEDQIAELRPGASATVTVDAYPGRKFSGHVESLSAGTGARFSLLPPDNASGNFTKVVQRVPVLIRLDPHSGAELRPGLSVIAKVSTK